MHDIEKKMSYNNILGLDSFMEADSSFTIQEDEPSQQHKTAANLNSEPLFQDESSGDEELEEARRQMMRRREERSQDNEDSGEARPSQEREPLKVIYNLNRHKPFKNRGRKSREKYVFDPKLSALENLRKVPAFEDIEDMFKPKSGLFEKEEQLEEYQSAVFKNMICKEYATLRSYFCVLRQFKHFIEETSDRPYESSTDTTISNFVEFINNYSKMDSDNEDQEEGESGNNENVSSNITPGLEEVDKENIDPSLFSEEVGSNFKKTKKRLNNVNQDSFKATKFSESSFKQFNAAFKLLYTSVFNKPMRDDSMFISFLAEKGHQEKSIKISDRNRALLSSKKSCAFSYEEYCRLMRRQYKHMSALLPSELSFDSQEGPSGDGASTDAAGRDVNITRSGPNGSRDGHVNEREDHTNRMKIAVGMVEKFTDLSSSPFMMLVEFALSFTCLFRDTTKKGIEIQHIAANMTGMPNTSSQMGLSILRVKERVKSIKKGFFSSFILRHRDPMLCPVLAISMLMFMKLRTQEQFDKLNEGGKRWYNELIMGHSYSTSKANIEKAFSEEHLVIASKTHAGRNAGAIYANEKGCDHKQLLAAAGWATMKERSEYTYIQRSSSDILNVMAGFEVKDVYHVGRSHIPVPSTLKEKVFPWMSGYTWEKELKGLKKTMEFYAEVLLQDMPFIFKQQPDNCLKFIEPFCTLEFEEFERNVLENFQSVNNEEETVNSNDLKMEIQDLKEKRKVDSGKIDTMMSLLNEIHRKQCHHDIREISLQNGYDIINTSMRTAELHVQKLLQKFYTDMNEQFKTATQELKSQMESTNRLIREFLDVMVSFRTVREDHENKLRVLSGLLTTMESRSTRMEKTMESFETSEVAKRILSFSSGASKENEKERGGAGAVTVSTVSTDDANTTLEGDTTLVNSDGVEDPAGADETVMNTTDDMEEEEEEEEEDQGPARKRARTTGGGTHMEGSGELSHVFLGDGRIVFDTTPEYRYDSKMPFSRFILDWFCGCAESKNIPLVDIRKNYRGWIKKNKPNSYSRYRKVALLLRDVFGDSVERSDGLRNIDRVMRLALSVDVEPRLQYVMQDVGKLSTFLIGSDPEGKKLWPNAEDRSRVLRDAIERAYVVFRGDAGPSTNE